jgi:hypothetical protein
VKQRGWKARAKNPSKVYLYDAERDGKRKVWTVYADSAEEAEETAKSICRLFGALYIGNLTGNRECFI